MKDIERMVLSAHTDGEVEAPWKDQVTRKIVEDPAWAAEASLQAKLRAVLAASPEPDFSEALARVRAKVEAGSRHRTRTLPLAWFSVAAAALLVLAAGGGYLWGRQSAATGPAEVSELQVQVPRQLELKLSGEGQLIPASTLQGIRR